MCIYNPCSKNALCPKLRNQSKKIWTIIFATQIYINLRNKINGIRNIREFVAEQIHSTIYNF
jgi:hypothetical protein